LKTVNGRFNITPSGLFSMVVIYYNNHIPLGSLKMFFDVLICSFLFIYRLDQFIFCHFFAFPF
jgi:hypothetical protein